MENFLIVEGQSPERLEQILHLQQTPYHQQFAKLVHDEFPHAMIDFAFPAQLDFKSPSIDELQKYTGVLWTGSSLSVLHEKPEVLRQIELAQKVFKSHVPFYGSCWGLQVATVAAGGKVRLSLNGYEAGLTAPIHLTKEGRKHFMLQNRQDGFQSFCIHHDEIEDLPKHSTLLATNAHSFVQAAEIECDGGIFWGVQYHPEFTRTNMLGILKERRELFLEKGTYTANQIDTLIQNIQNDANLPHEVSNDQQYSIEIRNWLHVNAF